MMTYWNNYIKNIDILIRESLILNVQWSMKNIVNRRSSPKVLINVRLENQKVSFQL